MVLEKTLESPLDCKEIQPVHPKGDQSWVFIGRTDVETETLILWPPHGKRWLIGKDPGAGINWGQEEKGMTEDEMAGWHHWLDGHEFGWTLGVGDGQGGLVCCDSWGRKESDTTERLKWTELRQHIQKQRHYFVNKGPSSQGYGFSVIMYGCELDYKESWVPKNWCFWLWCWRKLLRVPWTARRSNQSILKEISPGCLLEGLMWKLKLQYFGHLMGRADSLEKTLMLGKIEGRRRRGRQRMR